MPVLVQCTREKGRDLTRTCDKSPHTNRKFRNAKWQHKNTTKMFDFTAIAGRLRTVIWSNCSHQTGVVDRFYCPNLPTPNNSRAINWTQIKKKRQITFLIETGPTKAAITFLSYEIKLSYLASVFLMTRPFQWYHKFWMCDLLLKNFNIRHNFFLS